MAQPLHTEDLAGALGRELSTHAEDGNGWTDLHYAALLNSASAVRELLDSGVGVDVRMRSDGEQLEGDALKALYRFGFRFTTWKREGEAPLHLAAWSNATAAAGVLIEAGADVDATILSGWTPLHVAARYDATETAALLLERGARIDPRDAEAWTPLHVTVVADALKTGALLLEHGADVNARAKDQVTALHFTVLKDCKQRMDTPRFARLLLDHGANANVRAMDVDVTPKDIAAACHLPVTEALLRRHCGDGTDEDPKPIAAANRTPDATRGDKPLARRPPRRRKPHKNGSQSAKPKRARRRGRR